MEKVTLRNKSGLPRLAALMLVAILSCIGTKAFAEDIDGLSYTISGNTATVTGFASDASDKTTVTIPATITKDGITYNVTAIDHEAFKNNTDLTSVTISNGVTSIGESAFQGCSSLESVEIPSSVTSIGKDAFYQCDKEKLKKVIVKDIAKWCGISFGNVQANPLFYAKNLYSDADTKITDLEIPDDVTSIGKYAFYEYTGMTSVKIPNSVTSIGVSAFCGCKSLSSVTFPSSVTSIESQVFYYCSGLKTVTSLREEPPAIDFSAFYACYNIETVYVPKESVDSYKDKDGWKDFGDKIKALLEITYKKIDGKDELTVTGVDDGYTGALEIPATATYGGATLPVTSISAEAFKDNSGITSVTIGENVTEIGASAFKGCTGLTSIVIGSNVTTIGQNAFSGCNNNNLTSIEIPSSVTYIGSCAFYCDKLTKVIIRDIAAWCKIIFYGDNFANPLNYAHHLYLKTDNGEKEITELRESDLDGVTKIGAYAFFNCKGLTSVTIPSSVSEIGLYAFSGCSNLTKVVVKDIATWCKMCFGYDTNPLYYAKHLYSDENTEIKDLVIPDDVTSIGRYAFNNCEGLTSVTIPSSVENIGEEAFAGCKSLQSVAIGSGVTSIGSLAFKDCTGLTTITSKAVNPPSIETSPDEMHRPSTATFAGIAVSNVTLYVPYGSVEKYEDEDSGWSGFKIEALSPLKFEKIEGKDELVVTGIEDGYTGVLEIPKEATYNGTTLPVTSISGMAFGGCSKLTSVSIPNSVTSIGESAFDGCISLESVNMPDGITTISPAVFGGCKSLKSVIIGEKVESIGRYAFHNCSELSSITIPNKVTNIDAGAFSGCTKLTKVTSNIQEPFEIRSDIFDAAVKESATLYVPKGTKEKYAAAGGWDFTNIDDGTTDEDKDDEDKDEDKDEDNPDDEEKDDEGEEETPDEDKDTSEPEPDITERNDDGVSINFNYGDNTQEVKVTKGDYSGEVTIPETVGDIPVTGIESDAFSGCTDLTAVNIPRSVTTIGDNAFSGCSGLEAITIRSTIEAIGAGAFEGCTALKKVVAEDIPAWCSIDFGGETANPLSRAGHLYSDENREIKDLVISENVENIGAHAFAGGVGLESVTVQNGAKNIGAGAFDGCVNITSVTIPGSVTSIGKEAFSGCTNLEKVVIDNISAWCGISFGSIESNPLYHAGHLYSDENKEITDLTIPNAVKGIGKFAFLGCTGLKSVTIGGNLKSDDDGNGVTSIGYGAFYGCSNLESVTIPGSVESIGEWAFGECGKLDSVTSHIQVPFAINDNVFSRDTKYYGTLRVPDGTADKYKTTAGWKEFANIDGGSSTGIGDINAEKVTIQSDGGALNVSGAKDGTRVVVYSMTGMVIGSGNVSGCTVAIPTGLRKGDIAIVRIGDTAVKVVMR